MDETTGPNAAKASTGNNSEPPGWDVDDARGLLDSANNAAGQARNAWLAFLGLLAYLVVAVGSVTHGDLLLDNPLTLPFANVELPLTGFFWLAPFLLVLVHLSLLVQHAILAHKYHHFTRAIAASEGNAPGSHPDRRLVHNYVFAQLLAGPRPSLMLELLMRAMVWVTLSVLPIATLLFFQVKFLAYHDVVVTNLQRVALGLDILLLIALPPLFCFPSLFRRRRTATVEWRSKPEGWLPRRSSAGIEWGPGDWPWRARWHHVFTGLIVTLLVASFSLLFATVPDTELDAMKLLSDGKTLVFGSDPDPVLSKPGGILGMGRRIVFTNANVHEVGLGEEHTFSLRGRELRKAHLDRAPLEKADLVGADLTGASLVEAGLEKADLVGADLTGASLVKAELQRASLCPENPTSEETPASETHFCANLQDADLTRARLDDVTLVEMELDAKLTRVNLRGAYLSGVDFRGATDLTRADFENAVLVDVLLPNRLSTVNFGSATIRNVDLQGFCLRNTNFRQAKFDDVDLRLADLRDADLAGADLVYADLTGADLGHADLTGADLGHADLTGAVLRGADLTGADLGHADLTGTDLRGAVLTGAILTYTGANLRGADLTAAIFTHTIGVNPQSVIPASLIEKLWTCPE